MPAIDITDEVFLTVPRPVLTECFGDVASLRRTWPDLILRVHEDRGDKGLRWTVDGALRGTMEVWLEPVLDGTVLHYFLRADEIGRPPSDRRVRAETRRRRLAARAWFFELKRRLETPRAPGCAPGLVSGRNVSNC